MTLGRFAVAVVMALVLLLIMEGQRFEWHTFALVVMIAALIGCAFRYYRDAKGGRN